MKKLLMGMLAIGSMAIVSCSQEEEQLLMMGGNFEDFTGEIVTEGTRTSMGENGSVLWSDADAISLFKMTGYHQKYAVKTAGATTAKFGYADFSESASAPSMNYAVYPFDEDHSINGTKLTLDLSSLATQEYTENTFENGKAVMVAKSSNTELAFTNAFSLAKIQLKVDKVIPGDDVKVTSIKLESATQALAGTATVDMSQDKPAAVFTGDVKAITLEVPSVQLTESPSDFIILVPATTFAEGDLTITINATVAGKPVEYATTMTSAVEFKRSYIKTLTKTIEAEDWTGTTGDQTVEVTVESAADANEALKTNANVKVTGEVEGALTIPSKSYAGEHKIDLSGATIPATGLTISVDNTVADQTVKELEVVVPNTTSTSNLVINAPGTTVTITGADGTIIDVIEATTADNTLIVGEDVIVKSLIIKKGNVILKGNVESIESEVATTIKLENDITLSAPVRVKTAVTIDLNGYSIKASDNWSTAKTDDAIFMVNRNGVLTINDSSAEKKGSIIANNAKLSCAIKLTEKADDSDPINFAKLVINAGVLEGNVTYAIGGNGNPGRGNTEVVMNGGEIKGFNYGIFTPQENGFVTINGGIITAVKAAIEMRSGNLVINGGEFTATISPKEANANGNGTTTAGAAVAISQHTTNKDLSATIKGGTFNGIYALYEVDLQDELVENISLSVTGGTFNGKVESENVKDFITKGAFTDAAVFNYITGANIELTMLADMTIDVAAWQNKALGDENTQTITINGNDKTLTFNQTNSDWNNICCANEDAKLIINNAKLTNAGYNNGPWNRHDLNFACDVELNNIESDKAIALKAGGAFTNVTINDANTSDTYALWIQPNGQTVTLDGCTIDMINCSDGRGIKIDEQYVSSPAKVTLKVSNTTFKTEEKSAILVKSVAGADITLSNLDITQVQADSINPVWVDEVSADYAGLVNVIGGTKIVEP